MNMESKVITKYKGNHNHVVNTTETSLREVNAHLRSVAGESQSGKKR